MNESATNHLVEYVASMAEDGCSVEEIAGVLHRVGFDMVAEQHGLQAAAEWARGMADESEFISSRSGSSGPPEAA